MKYSISVPVDSVQGYQFWEVEATSEKEAKEKFLEGKCHFVDEEVEIVSLDYNNLEIEEIEDE